MRPSARGILRAALLGGALLTATTAPADVPQLTRGPYLQLVTTEGAVIRWRTDIAVDSLLRYGPAPDQLSQVAYEAAPTVEHELPITGLAPAETVYYEIGWSGGALAGGDVAHVLTAAPPATSQSPIRAWVLGDSGTGDANAAAVRDGYLIATGGELPDLWLMLGDNAYTHGTDEQYQAAVFDTYPAFLRARALWPAIGNHDALSSDSATQTGPFFDNFSLPSAGEVGGVASWTEAYYAVDWANVHLVCLDSADSDLHPDGAMVQWLIADLAANQRNWLIAYFHHPPYSKGSHDSDDPLDSGGLMFAVRETLLPILESAGVDLVLAGHSHAYERSFLLDGHYATSDTFDPETMIVDGGSGGFDGDGPYVKTFGPNRGAVYVVAGSSGFVSGGSLDHPAMTTSHAELGSLDLDVHGSRLEVRFIDTDGATLDRFEIVKAFLLDGFESGDTSGWSTAVP